MLALVATGALVTLCTAVYAVLRYRLTYWQRRKVPTVAPSVPFGNYTLTALNKKNLSEVSRDMYFEHRDQPYLGTYFMVSPLLQIHDPEIIKQVFIKEFQDFNGRGTQGDLESDPLSGHIFFLGGQLWRNLRVKLSPAFTSGKIKYMFETITECADFMREHMEASMKAGGGAYEEDMRELAARFSTDVISSVAFGIESNSMKNPDSEFRRMGQSVFASTFANGVRSTLLFFGSDLRSKLGIRSVSPDIHNFFTRIVDEMVTYRERNKVERADMLSLLIRLKNEGFLPPDSAADAKRTCTPEDKEKLTMKQVMAHVFVFFLAGFETTSTTTSFTLLELAKHPDIQQKLRQEIDAMLAKNGGQITYDAIMNLPYMEMVIQEGHPPHDPRAGPALGPPVLARAGPLRPAALLRGEQEEPAEHGVPALRRRSSTLHRYAIGSGTGEDRPGHRAEQGHVGAGPGHAADAPPVPAHHRAHPHGRHQAAPQGAELKTLSPFFSVGDVVQKPAELLSMVKQRREIHVLQGPRGFSRSFKGPK